MPIQFRCSECQKRLVAPTRKAGAALHCPSCHSLIAVPEAGASRQDGAEGDSASSGDMATDGAVAGESSWSVASSSARSSSVAPDLIAFPATESASQTHHASSGSDWIGVSRLTVFLQGVLLAVTAVVFFVAGMVVGRHSSGPSAGVRPAAPAQLTGRVLYRRQGRTRADEGAVVMLLPADSRPDSKLGVEGLRPGDAPISDLHPSLQAIHAWGGDYARVDRNGRFRLRVHKGGPFFLLVVSAAVARGEQRPELEDLAQIGRFFLPAVDLLADRAYQWRRLEVVGERDLSTIVIRPPDR